MLWLHFTGKCNYTAVMRFMINYVGRWKQTIEPKGNYQYTNMFGHLQVIKAKAQTDSQRISSALVKEGMSSSNTMSTRPRKK